MLTLDVIAKITALIDAEQTADAPENPADDASDHGADGTGGLISLFRAVVHAADHALGASADRGQEE